MHVSINMRLAVAVALIFGALPAHAGTALASISNLHVKLIDLRPEDGIAPSLSIYSTGGTWGSISSYGGANRQLLSFSTDYQPNYAAAINVALGSSGLGQSTVGNVFDLSAEGWNASMRVDTTAPITDIRGDLSTSMALYVSPFTAVEITAQVNLTVTPASPDEILEASAYLEAYGNNYTASGASSTFSNGIPHFYTNTNGHYVESSSAVNFLSATFANLSEEDALTPLSARILASGTANLPVPEPQSAALFLAGLFAIATRRRLSR